MQTASNSSARVASLILSAALSACAEPSESLERLPLLPVNDTPGCSVTRPQVLPNDPAAGTLEALTLAQLRDRDDMDLGFIAQLTLLMIRPILNDPAAVAWSEVQESGRYEAEVVSEGDTWVTIRAVFSRAVSGGGPAREERVVDIDVTEGRTAYSIEGRSFEVTGNSLVYDRGTRGCDPETGTSFAILPSNIVDGVVQNAPRCWGGDARSLLSCVQIIERTVNRL